MEPHPRPQPDQGSQRNVAPTQRVPVLRRVADDPQDDKPELVALRWGLIADWARACRRRSAPSWPLASRIVTEGGTCHRQGALANSIST